MSKMKRMLEVVSCLRSLADSLEGLADQTVAEYSDDGHQVQNNHPVAEADAHCEDQREAVEHAKKGLGPDEMIDTDTGEIRKIAVEDVRALATSRATTKGLKTVLRSILQEFGVPNITSLKPEQYKAFMEEVDHRVK